MCVVCFHTYNINTTHIVCCDRVLILPSVRETPRLVELNCRRSAVLDIPPYPQLCFLDISETLVSEIPIFPFLITLHCVNTKIKCIPYNPRLRYLFAYDCRFLIFIQDGLFNGGFTNGSVWLNPKNETVSKLVKIQKFFKKTKNRREFYIRLYLIKHLPFTLVNFILSYL